MADYSWMASYEVYVGLWTDWSRGRILGATLTLPRYSNGHPGERETLLLNVAVPNSDSSTLLSRIYSHRHHVVAIWVALLPIFALAFLCLGGFTLAGGFTSRVAAAINAEVLLVGGARCGYVDLSMVQDNLTALLELYTPVITQSLVTAESYARRCYASDTPAGAGCETFVRKRLLPSAMNTTAACPFDSAVCLSSSSNLFLDSGFLDSDTDFGRNAPEDQRFQYRRVVQCAPLATEEYKSYLLSTEEGSKVRYHYGDSFTDTNGTTADYTEEFPLDNYINLTTLFELHGDTGYDYSIRFHLAEPRGGLLYPSGSSFRPIPELAKQDADVYLFFLTADGVAFGEPVYDPWYRATRFGGQIQQDQQPHQQQDPLVGIFTAFRQDEPGSPLACSDQHQLCFPGSPRDNKCTDLMSSADLRGHAYIDQFFDDDDERRRGIEWILNTTVKRVAKILHPVSGLGVQALTSRIGLNGGHQARLPANQWQLDVQHWYSAVMAQLQQLFITAAVGPKGWELDPIYHYAESPIEKKICGNQRARMPNYISFSFFGLTLVLALGGAFILVSWILEPISAYLSRRSGYYTVERAISVPYDDAEGLGLET